MSAHVLRSKKKCSQETEQPTRSPRENKSAISAFGNVENLQKNEFMCYVLVLWPCLGVCSISVYLELYINVVFRNVGKELLNSSLTHLLPCAMLIFSRKDLIISVVAMASNTFITMESQTGHQGVGPVVDEPANRTLFSDYFSLNLLEYFIITGISI